jgi:hypothetical protein
MGATLLVRNVRSTPVKRGPPAPPCPPATRRALTRRAKCACWCQGFLEYGILLCLLGLFSIQHPVCPRTMTTPSAEGVAP